MDNFFGEFEEGTLGVFKRFPEAQRERIVELFTKETQAAQEKLEAEALKKWEEEKKQEEAKAAEDAKKAAADPKAKKAPPPKKGAGKDADKPNLDVPTLPVPEVVPYESEMGNKFLYERQMDEIALALVTPAPLEEEEVKADPDMSRQESNIEGEDSKLDSKKEAGTPKPEGEEDEEDKEEEKEEFLPEKVENDHMEKAEMQPPKDPEGIDCLVPDLLVSKERIIEILEKALKVTLEWLIVEKDLYNVKAINEGKTL